MNVLYILELVVTLQSHSRTKQGHAFTVTLVYFPVYFPHLYKSPDSHQDSVHVVGKINNAGQSLVPQESCTFSISF